MYSLSEVQSKRLNIVKMLFAFFVVFSHCNLSNIHFDDSNIETVAIETFEFVRYLFSGLLPEAAVPGFFLMSSIFLYKKDFDWAENVKKKGSVTDRQWRKIGIVWYEKRKKIKSFFCLSYGY